MRIDPSEKTRHDCQMGCTTRLSNTPITVMIIETTYSQAREQVKSLLDRAVDDREVVIVRRRSGGAVALIAADELESLVERAHLLRSPKNAERLLAALARARAEEGTPMPLDDLARQVGLVP